MNKLIFVVLLITSATFATTNLDSLLSVGKSNEQKTHHIGFLSGKSAPKKVIEGTPKTLLPSKGFSKGIIKGFEGPVEEAAKQGSDITIKDYFTLLRDVDSLKNNQEKITQIITSLQTQSVAHSDNSDFILKLVEILLGALATVVVGYISAKATGKKDNKAS
jgi:hypothetical protein